MLALIYSRPLYISTLCKKTPVNPKTKNVFKRALSICTLSFWSIKIGNNHRHANKNLPKVIIKGASKVARILPSVGVSPQKKVAIISFKCIDMNSLLKPSEKILLFRPVY
tara:strand:- start:45 stop:374 length:330 start_codon:yes stop_codon:yes gene_type:complete